MDALRIVFLDSWKPASHEGSGTAVGISALGKALMSLGHRVEVLRPVRDADGLAARVAFNFRIPRHLDAGPPPDLVVGFDLDGFRWGPSPLRRSPYVVALKGVAADEAQFSRTLGERSLLTVLAHLERLNAGSADRILVPSRYSARMAAEAYGLSRERMWLVPEPLEMPFWDRLRAAPPGPPREPTILSVARQYPRKDTATLLQALPLVRSRVPDVHLRIVGGGPELPRLRRLAGRLGLHGAVTFQGAVPGDDEVRRAYFEAHVFCLPSRQEGFGIVFLEAMAAGLPVVAARAGAAPEVLTEGETAFLVPPGEPRALADALLRLLGDGAVRRRMGAAGIGRARQFDLEAVGRRFLEVVDPLLPSRPAAA